MKTVNRGFFTVRPAQPMIKWSEQFDEFLVLDEFSEPTVYLIEEDFMEEEPILKSHFKKIFLNELNTISDDESLYPEIKWEIFSEWFTVEAGTSVFDLESSDLKSF